MKPLPFFVGLVTTLLLPVHLLAAEVRGVIVSVDSQRNELLMEKIAGKMPKQSFVVDDRTQVLYGKEKGTLKDIPAGRRARVEVEERDGKRVVTAIHVNGRPPKVTAKVEGSAITGTLRRVALTDREVVVIGPGAKGKETETTIVVPEAAKVLRDGKAIGFDELREGDKVAVTAEKRDGLWTATAIQTGMVAATPTTVAKSNTIPRLRLLLRIIDGVLQRMEGTK